MKDFKCKVTERGLHITGIAQNLMGEDYPVSLWMSLDEGNNLDWDAATKWAADHGKIWSLPTRAQGIAISGHYDEINKVLKKANKPVLRDDCYYRTNEKCSWDLLVAHIVGMDNGVLYWGYNSSTYSARAVSAILDEH